MKTPKAPTPPDPVATAAAQTGTNISTAQANAILGNVNQVTPDGSLTYSQSGKSFIEDATGGQTYWRGPNGEIQTSAPTTTTTAAGTGRALTASEERGLKSGFITPEQAETIKRTGGGGTTTSGPAAGWSQVKGYYIPQYTATQTLSDAGKAIKTQDDAASLNLSTIAANQSNYLKDYLSQGVDTSSLPPRASLTGLQTTVPSAGGIQSELGSTAGNIQYGFGDAGAITKTYGTDFSQDRQRVEDALMARLNPSLEKDRTALQTQLSNQGIKLGSTAYDRGVDELTRQSNDARLGAILNAGQEQSRLVGLEANRATFENSAQQQNYGQLLGRAEFNNSAQQQDFGQLLDRANFANGAQQQLYGQNLSSAGFTNQALGQQYAADNSNRDSALQEQFALRNQPINEIAALMNGSQLTAPNFVNANMPQIPTVDYAGLVQSNYQAQQAAYEQQMASRNSMMGGLLGFAGTALTAGLKYSDRRLKTDIKQVGEADNGLPIYAYRYKAGGPMQLGVMADEAEAVNPHAVHETASGYKAVNYGEVFA